MADVQANIVLTTTGGEESASEVRKASAAVGELTQSSGGMQAQFQQRFQHIGLMLFAGDALRASGLGRETRMVVSSLNLALEEGAAMAGISAGGMMLLVTALAALAAIAVKVIQHHKDEAESLGKVAEQQSKAYQGYVDEASSIEKAAAAGVGMTGAMFALLAADQAVAEDMRANLMSTQEKEIAALERQRDALASTQAMHESLATAMGLVKDAARAVFDSFDRMLAPLVGVSNAIKDMIAHIPGMTSGLKEHVTLTGDAKLKYDELTVAIAKVRLQHEQMATGVGSDFKEMEKSAEDYWKTVSEGERAQQELITKLHKEIAADQKKQFEEEAKLAQKAADSIGSAFGNAFAKMIVEGKSFTESLQQSFTQMAEQVIADIVRMIIEWEILMALGFPAGGAAGGFSGFLGGAFATGGSRVVDSPTLFMAGEAGPEVATFTPIGGSAQDAMGGQGASINIGTVQTTVNGVQDPARIADQVGDQIIQRIRGMGELNFTRT